MKTAVEVNLGRPPGRLAIWTNRTIRPKPTFEVFPRSLFVREDLGLDGKWQNAAKLHSSHSRNCLLGAFPLDWLVACRLVYSRHSLFGRSFSIGSVRCVCKKPYRLACSGLGGLQSDRIPILGPCMAGGVAHYYR